MILDRIELVCCGAVIVALLALLGYAGYSLATGDFRVGLHPSAVGSTTNQIPAAPLDTAPPYANLVNAIGCAQTTTITSQVGAGILVVNTGTIQLKLADGPVPIPAWPLAPGSWIHFALGAAGTYEVTGTRYSCAASGKPAPHFRLTITVP